MNKTTSFLLGLVIGVAVSVLLWIGRNASDSYTQPIEIHRDTIIDTILYRVAIPFDSVVIRYTNALLPVAQQAKDTFLLTVHDSVMVSVPIMQKEYKDSTYHAWISGYQPNLDSIYIYRPTTHIIQTISKQKRWGLGVQAGLGVTANKIQPYIGVGVSYNLLMW